MLSRFGIRFGGSRVPEKPEFTGDTPTDQQMSAALQALNVSTQTGDALLLGVAAAAEYQGFSPAAVRKLLKDSFPTTDALKQWLTVAMGFYAVAGPNFGKLVARGKVREPEKLAAVVQRLKAVNAIAAKGKFSGRQVTLTHVAKAYPALAMYARAKLGSRMAIIFPSSGLIPKLQDLALGGAAHFIGTDEETKWLDWAETAGAYLSSQPGSAAATGNTESIQAATVQDIEGHREYYAATFEAATLADMLTACVADTGIY